LQPIPRDPDGPELRASAFFEEFGAADKRKIGYADWFRRPRWERAAMLARDRLQIRLEYWQARWAQGHDLPEVKVQRG